MFKNSIILLICISALSCQKPKDWNCDCSVDAQNNKGTFNKTIVNEKSSQAIRECNDYGIGLTGANGSADCKITEK
jgi:hypothetical protein